MSLFLVMDYHNYSPSSNLPIARISVLVANILLSQIKQAFIYDAICCNQASVIKTFGMKIIITGFYS